VDEQVDPKRTGAPTIGDVEDASASLFGSSVGVRPYELNEWEALDADRKKNIIDAIEREFSKIKHEIETIGYGASEQSIRYNRWRTYLKLSLIVTTSTVAAVNLAGAWFSRDSSVVSVVAGLLAIVVGGIATIDSHLGFNEEALHRMELYYKCMDAYTTLQCKWVVAGIPDHDYRSYRNACVVLDLAQRELQQIYNQSRRIMQEGTRPKDAPPG